MNTKTRTWPASVCADPTNERAYNVRTLDGTVAFTPGVESRIAVQAADAINQSYDHGRDAS